MKRIDLLRYRIAGEVPEEVSVDEHTGSLFIKFPNGDTIRASHWVYKIDGEVIVYDTKDEDSE